jgi:hypothetical protein
LALFKNKILLSHNPTWFETLRGEVNTSEVIHMINKKLSEAEVETTIEPEREIDWAAVSPAGHSVSRSI